jgi:hypothetical protein
MEAPAAVPSAAGEGNDATTTSNPIASVAPETPAPEAATTAAAPAETAAVDDDARAPPPPPPPTPPPLLRFRFAHAPELLLFAVDVSPEAALPATRAAAAPQHEEATPSDAPPPRPTRFDALASVALLIARAKAALLPPADPSARARRSRRRRHRFGLLACRDARAEYVEGSLTTEPAQLEAALARLRPGQQQGAPPAPPSSSDSDSFDFGSLADAAADAARDAHDAASPPACVRVVLLYTRSRAPAPLALSREGALDALWRCRASLPSLHVDVLYAYDPSSASPAPAAAAAAGEGGGSAPATTTTTATATTTTTTTPQQVFSRLEACVDALSAAVPHALLLPDLHQSPAARDAARRNHGYVLDVSVFAPRRLLAAGCQLVSHPLQRPGLARPPPPPDLARVRSVALPSEAGSRRAHQLQQLKREEMERQSSALARQRSLGAGGGGGGAEDGGGDDEEGRDEWGLPLPTPPPPPPAAAAAASGNPPPLLVDITDQMMRRAGDVSSFPVAGSGPETETGEEDGGGGGGGGVATMAIPTQQQQQQQQQQHPAPSPPPPGV